MLSVWIVVALLGGLLAGALAMWLVLRDATGYRAARIAEMQRDSFLALANERLGAVVSPVAQKLNEFDAMVKALEKDRIGAYEGLREQITGLIERSGKMEAAATHLTSALRNPSTRGKWGEMQLRRVVELAGMEAYCDFEEQQTFDTGDERGRPDLTVALPGNAKIFVDAKAPLNAYLDAIEAPGEAARREGIRMHAAAFKNHIDALARKNYHRAGGSVNFVVMFIPGEAFLSAACTENPGLIEYGAGKNVYIASPLTLITLLRSYALGWQQQQQEENAKKIAVAAAELYDRVRIFSAHFGAIGSNLQKANDAFNKAVGSMESRVLPQGRKIKELASLPDADLTELQAIDVAPREVTALDAQPSKKRANQRSLFS
jgi:DNA recombination protein RmuC